MTRQRYWVFTAAVVVLILLASGAAQHAIGSPAGLVTLVVTGILGRMILRRYMWKR